MTTRMNLNNVNCIIITFFLTQHSTLRCFYWLARTVKQVKKYFLLYLQKKLNLFLKIIKPLLAHLELEKKKQFSQNHLTKIHF